MLKRVLETYPGVTSVHCKRPLSIDCQLIFFGEINISAFSGTILVFIKRKKETVNLYKPLQNLRYRKALSINLARSIVHVCTSISSGY